MAGAIENVAHSPASAQNGPSPSHYAGRFAPTPSGPLHLGSLLTAVASWLDARAHNGRWSVRIDDLDTPRVLPQAEATILRTLERHGLTWDGPVIRQSEHVECHRAALDRLATRCFACRCTRRELGASTAYPGTCRDLRLARPGNAVRVRTDAMPIRFEDRVQGPVREDLTQSVGDFVVWRRDGFASYQLAVVMDDDAMAITHVVRGADLLDNTPRQLHLLRFLGLSAPVYAHVPVILEANGVKLSKHNDATAIDDSAARVNVATVLGLLGLDPPWGDVEAMLAWARRHWDIAHLPAATSVSDFAALA